jgi:SulP family sulfate permease
MMIVVTALRLDIYIMFIPSAVMEGFSVAAAAIISGNQIQLAFGLPKGIPRHEEFYMNIYESLAHMSHANSLATFMFISTTAALLILIRWAPTVPWSIFMVVISIMLGMSVDGTDSGWAKVQTLKSRYGELHLRLFDFSIPSFPAPRDIYTTQTQTFWALMYASVSVTFVALLGTLIAARVADRLTATKFAQAREVFGCGVANLLSGVFGGVPGGAALARTSLNIKSGATSRMSGAISAVAIMVISMALLEYFRYLQLPVIAAILVVVAIRMIEVKQLYHMYLYDKKTFGIAMFTAAVCILKDPTGSSMQFCSSFAS